MSLAEPSFLAHSPHNSSFVGPSRPCPSAQGAFGSAWGTEPLDPYGEGTELSQEHPFLFVLGSTVPLNCKYLCGSKQSRDCVRSTGSWAGTFPWGQWAGHKRVTKKKKKLKIPWFIGKIQLHFVPTGSRDRRDWHCCQEIGFDSSMFLFLLNN